MAGWGLSHGRISTIQQKLSIINDSGSSRCGGEERPPGRGAIVMR